jgi:hypothetical protein
MRINQFSFMEIIFHPVIQQLFYFWQVLKISEVRNSYRMDQCRSLQESEDLLYNLSLQVLHKYNCLFIPD